MEPDDTPELTAEEELAQRREACTAELNSVLREFNCILTPRLTFDQIGQGFDEARARAIYEVRPLPKD